ncbi:hypothetical protein LLEC1_01916 [Akanthomyces lecanii]|uniref:NAD(P)-binding domain-containing protein n=1 Tax=Cordyceps confragosa TaxID=2714763 RepID=A0A179HZU8_CORDF|nr:hypothetical protein LLEC1_01916 [Akanthomyces lecanii]
MPSVIVFGASGFVGAPYIKAIKAAHPDWPVTAYIRATVPAKHSPASLGVDRLILGTFSDFSKVQTASSEHDIAVNAGNSFTADPVAAIIAGQTQKKNKSSRSRGTVIHISGGGNFIDHGTSGNFNPHSKVWNDADEDDIRACHILDLVNFLVTISDVAAQGPAQGSAFSRFYMLETARVSWKDLATELARAMHARGIFASAEPKSVPFEQAGEGEVKHLVAANMLMQGDRARAMGFRPQHPSILTQIHEDLKTVPI